MPLESSDSVYYSTARGDVACFLPKLDNPAVLEIGCGEGAFTKHIPLAREYWGVEPFARAARVAGSRLTRVFVDSYERVCEDIPRDYFDLVICNDVIEHMIDHDWFLADIKRKMTSSGVLIGSVPNVRHFSVLFRLLIKRDFPYTDSGILDRTHLRFFTERSLYRSLVDAGYRVDLLRPINSSFRTGHSPLGVVHKHANRMLSWLTFGHTRDIEFVQIAFRAMPVSQ